MPSKKSKSQPSKSSKSTQPTNSSPPQEEVQADEVEVAVSPKVQSVGCFQRLGRILIFSCIALIGFLLLKNKFAQDMNLGHVKAFRTSFPVVAQVIKEEYLPYVNPVMAYSFIFALGLGFVQTRVLKVYSLYVALLLVFFVACMNRQLIGLVMTQSFANDEFYKQVYGVAGWIALIGGCLSY